MILYLTILFVLCFIGCIIEILIYKDCDHFKPLEFLIHLTIGIFCLFAIFYLWNK